MNTNNRSSVLKNMCENKLANLEVQIKQTAKDTESFNKLSTAKHECENTLRVLNLLLDEIKSEHERDGMFD